MKIIKLIIALFFLLILIVLLNTLRFTTKQISANPVQAYTVEEQSLENFRDALRIKTISYEPPKSIDVDEFKKFNAFLGETYPSLFANLEHQTFLEFSHLLKWQGSNPKLNPIVLLGHHDVVPIASANQWVVDPFAGEIVYEKIMGRGTIDDKISVIGLLEAVRHLIKDGFKPERTIYLAFGHDEEIGGEGAKKMAAYLNSQGVQAEFVLDEGQAITRGIIPGIEEDVALIGTAEKGFTTLELSIQLRGGHSSMPSKETAIDVIAKHIAKLKDEPFPAKITPPMQGFIDYLGPEMKGLNKVAFANMWLFEPMVLNTYQNVSSGNALVRTTTSPTVFNAGIKENIIPTNASALVNFRILPGDSIESVIERVKQIIDDPRVNIRTMLFNSEPTKVSPTDNNAFSVLTQSLKEVYPNMIVAPNLVVGATDARHYSIISDNIYRFAPYSVDQNTIGTFHGPNEHIHVDDFYDAIRFYRQLIINSTGAN